MINKKSIALYSITGAFLIFALVSFLLNFEPGIKLMNNYFDYIKFILMIMPAVFLLIGLFNIWVKRETVMKFMGNKSGIKGYVLAIILAFTCIGGLFTALPIAKQLHDKGSKLSVVLVYLGASCVCRVPMSLWEISLLGAEFTLIRYLVSIPMIIISSIIIEKLLNNNKQIEAMKGE